MAKKRKSTKKSAPAKPQHSLPAGFWSQVGAVMLILLSLLLVVSWFGVGGPVLQWIDMATVKTIGYTAYALPIFSCNSFPDLDIIDIDYPLYYAWEAFARK